MNMKIEKINDNQIRCTLTKEDLASRQLKLSELAYGTEKAKRLFREMMQQANFEFGFEAEDIPLMIEAIPMNAECVVLLITKVEDPEELDTRFARFSPSAEEEDRDSEESDDVEEWDDSRESDLYASHSAQVRPSEIPHVSGTRIFHFRALSEVMTAASCIGAGVGCDSALYKDHHNGGYLMAVAQREDSPEQFIRVSNTLSEYAAVGRVPNTGWNYLAEHYKAILPANALECLAGETE